MYRIAISNMGYYDIIASRMILNTLLYAISELSKVKDRIKRIISGQQMVVQITIREGGPTEYLEIKDEAIYFEREKKYPSFDGVIYFNNPQEFLRIAKELAWDFSELEFEGKVEMNGPPNFKESCEKIINFALPYSNNTIGDDAAPEDEAIQIKIILYALISGFQEITEEDENVREEMRGVDVVIQVVVTEGPQCYLFFKDGSFSGCMDEQDYKPTVIIRLSNLKAARDLLTGKGNAGKMLLKGDIQIEGDVKHAMKLMNLNELLMGYYDYIKQRQKK